MKKTDIKDDLASIRNLMERSSKFISLSGLSGILAGVYALIGVVAVYIIGENQPSVILCVEKVMADGRIYDDNINDIPDYRSLILKLTFIALAVLIASVLTAIQFSHKKAKRNNQPFWSATSRDLLFNMCVPLITGGILITILVVNHYYWLIVPASLIFYGLSLVNASNFTFTDVKYLGLLEIALGLISALFPAYGLYFWAIGFGVLHIIYGSVMYLKYDR